MPEIKVYNSAGQEVFPKPPLSATFMRDTFLRHSRVHQHVFSEELQGHTLKEGAGETRYQHPFVVILHQYDSRLQLFPQRREMFLYAPAGLNMATKLAHECWRLWIKKLKPGQQNWNVPAEDDYPKIEDLMVAHPIDDETFIDAWNHAKKLDSKLVKTAGDPQDPFVFMVVDDSVRLFSRDNDTRDLHIEGI